MKAHIFKLCIRSVLGRLNFSTQSYYPYLGLGLSLIILCYPNTNKLKTKLKPNSHTKNILQFETYLKEVKFKHGPKLTELNCILFAHKLHLI